MVANWTDRALNILVVQGGNEDIRGFCKQLQQCSETGCSVKSAESSRSAVELMRQELFDLLFLNLLTEGDEEPLKAIQDLHHQAPDTPIIVMASPEQEELALQMMECGTQDYLLRSEVEYPGILRRVISHALQRQSLENELHYIANYDQLTGLINRSLFHENLVKAVAKAHRNDAPLSVLYLGLDRFKPINDTFGHSVGDTLLKSVSRRLKGCLREYDTVAYLGGDEFAVILDDIPTIREYSKVSTKILEVMERPFRIADHEIHVTASIGLSSFPDCGRTADDLIKSANIAMYRAKEMGRSSYQFYTAEMNMRALERLTLENSLRSALEKGQFELHYQPQVDSQNGSLRGAEALLRWKHPDMGFVSPVEFIPIAEETGMIVDIGEWVIEEVCRQIKAWDKEGFDPTRISVNISARQFQQKALVSSIFSILEKGGVAPELLGVELTESVVMGDAVSSSTTLSLLREKGIHVHIDDFGTGYSSLNYLKLFPIDTLKIDRSFIRDITNKKNDEIIATAIIGLAHNLGMEVVAEGVEDQDQLDLLKEKGCDIIQGYYTGKPMAAADFSAWRKKLESSEKKAAS